MLFGATLPDGFDEIRGERMIRTPRTEEQKLKGALNQFLVWLLNEDVLEDAFHGYPFSKVVVIEEHGIPELLLPDLLLGLVAVLDLLEDLLEFVHPTNALLEEW